MAVSITDHTVRRRQRGRAGPAVAQRLVRRSARGLGPYPPPVAAGIGRCMVNMAGFAATAETGHVGDAVADAATASGS
jgi:hypothetical protein